MNAEEIFKVLSPIHPLSEDFKNSFIKNLTPLTLPKNHLLLEAPKISDHIYFLNKGFGMGYTFVEGRRYVTGFWKAGQMMISYKSFFEKTPSLEYIQVVTKSEVHCLSYSALQYLLSAFAEWRQLFLILMSREIQAYQK